MSRFEPEIVPENTDALIEFLTRHIANIQLGITFLESVALKVLHSEPHGLHTGLVVYADGTDWNPGSGEGLYVRTSTPAWVKL